MRDRSWLIDSPLANRNYAYFLAGAFVSSLGAWMQTVALGWTVLQLGNSGFLLGLLGFVQLAPVLVLGIPAGIIADRAPRRHFLLVTQGAAAALAIALAALTLRGYATVPVLLAIAAGNGIVNALNGPTWQAFIGELVGPEQLRRAIALNSARFNLTRIVGPAIGGWLLVRYGPGACFLVNAVSFVGVLGALSIIRTARRPPRGAARPTAGTLAVARNPRLRAVLLPAIGLTVLALPYANFLPAMARDVFGAGAGGLSTLLTATGIGAIVGAILSGQGPIARRPGQALAAFQVAAGLALAAFALAPGLALGVAAIGLFGVALIGYMATANATIQLAAEPGTEGRALALWMIVNSGLVPLGSLAIGAATEVWSPRAALGAAGLGCALCGLIAAYVAVRPRAAHPRATRHQPGTG